MFLYLAHKLTKEENALAENQQLWKVSGTKANDLSLFQSISFFDLNSTERTKVMQNYKKIIVVREPMERLLSAYKNKLENPTSTIFQKLSYYIHSLVDEKYQQE